MMKEIFMSWKFTAEKILSDLIHKRGVIASDERKKVCSTDVVGSGCMYCHGLCYKSATDITVVLGSNGVVNVCNARVSHDDPLHQSYAVPRIMTPSDITHSWWGNQCMILPGYFVVITHEYSGIFLR